jgi:hypothetical protein
MSYYLMPSGKLPMQNGSPVLITEAVWQQCCCDTVECEECKTGYGPEQWQVDIASIAKKGSSPGCNYFHVGEDPCIADSCLDLNATYIVTKVEDEVCMWEYDFPTNICRLGNIRLNVRKVGSDYHVRVTVRLDPLSISNHIIWDKDYGTSKPACQTLSEESIPFDSESYSVAVDCACDAASSTCKITAL